MNRSDPGVVSARRQIIAAWAVLVSVTLVAWWESGRASTPLLQALLLGATALKAGVVMGAYMEVARAPLWLKALCVAWGGAIFAAIGTLVVAS